MKTLEMTPALGEEIKPEKDNKLPSLDFVKLQTVSLNGNIMLVGLSEEQAEAIKRLVQDNGLEITDTELSDQDYDKLSSVRFPNVTEESRTLYLGRSSVCMLELYRLLT